MSLAPQTVDYGPDPKLIEGLQAVLGKEGVLLDAETRSLLTQDVYSEGEPALIVLKPLSAEALSEAIKLVAEAGLPVVPRGGGMSYTSGYIHSGAPQVTLDMRAMNRVLEIDTENMTVTVEAGISWAALEEALRPHGVRARFWGTLSGIKASVGGGLSQNGVFWGSGRRGTAAENVLALEVLLADGTLLRTGSWAHGEDAIPFTRHYGPDLTGLFLADAGALGIKTKAVLPLVPLAKAKSYISCEFDDWPELVAALSEIGRQGVASECFAFDPYLQSQRMKRASLAEDTKALAGVIKGQGSLLKGLKDGARVVMAGRRYMDNVRYSFHAICEGRSEAAAAADAAAVREIATSNGGGEIEASIPKIMASTPFGPVNNMIGPDGERWVPIHGLVAHGAVPACMRDLKDLEQEEAERITANRVGIGYLLMPVGAQAFVVEPVFFWEDALNDLHRDSVDPATLKRIKGFAPDPQAREVVEDLRAKMKAIFRKNKSVHMQIGRSYGYHETLSDPARSVMQDLKAKLDPKGLMNPGALLGD